MGFWRTQGKDFSPYVTAPGTLWSICTAVKPGTAAAYFSVPGSSPSSSTFERPRRQQVRAQVLPAPRWEKLGLNSQILVLPVSALAVAVV